MTQLNVGLSWFQLRSAHGGGIEPHIGTCAHHGVCLGVSIPLTLSCVLSLKSFLK